MTVMHPRKSDLSTFVNTQKEGFSHTCEPNGTGW